MDKEKIQDLYKWTNSDEDELIIDMPVSKVKFDLRVVASNS